MAQPPEVNVGNFNTSKAFRDEIARIKASDTIQGKSSEKIDSEAEYAQLQAMLNGNYGEPEKQVIRGLMLEYQSEAYKDLFTDDTNKLVAKIKKDGIVDEKEAKLIAQCLNDDNYSPNDKEFFKYMLALFGFEAMIPNTVASPEPVKTEVKKEDIKSADKKDSMEKSTIPAEDDPPEPEFNNADDVLFLQEDAAPIEATPDEDVFNLKMNQDGNVVFWYQTAEAYDIPEGLTAKDVYSVIRDLNGDPQHNKYAPDEVGLPKEITVKGVTVHRKDEFSIKGHNYKSENAAHTAHGTGTTYVGYKGIPGQPGVYTVRDKNGDIVGEFNTKEEAEQYMEEHSTVPSPPEE